MFMISSEEKRSAEQMLQKKSSVIVVDIETLDDFQQGLTNEPIVSFSVSIPSDSIASWDMPTVSVICEDLDEEQKLLVMIRRVLLANKDSVVAGHNISYQFKYISLEVPRWRAGYDLPKIQSRGRLYKIDFEFINRLSVFDCMDEGFKYYDHSSHNRMRGSERQRILKCEHFENDFGILRPSWLPRLGEKVRSYYQEYLKSRSLGPLQTILQYNACDTIAESIITKIFLHSFEECGADLKIVSPLRRCEHIPDEFDVESNSTWQRLKVAELTRID